MFQLSQNINTTLSSIERSVQFVLKDLDPSLFQNIILGILAIFIPFAIVFLTDLLDKKEERTEFEKMVWSEEVLNAKTIFWVSIIGVGLLSFFSGKDVSDIKKMVALLLTLILIYIFSKSFKRTLRFSEGYKHEFEISFLDGLKFRKIFRFNNETIFQKMSRAWSSFWSTKSFLLENKFTEIFVKHIGLSFKVKRFSSAIFLAKIYQNNIDKRDSFSVGYTVLPRLFEWSELCWEEMQRSIKEKNFEEKIKKLLPIKYLPTFQKWVLILHNRVQFREERFWDWYYFQREFFPAVVKNLLKGGIEPYQLFTSFKKYIDYSEDRLEKFNDEETKQHWWNYILSLFGSFSPVFFENIDKAPNNHEIWDHYFPTEWKITAANSKNRISRIILKEFLEWSQQKMFRKDGEDYGKDLSEVANGLFPNAHSSLFPSFLMLLFSHDLKKALKNEPNFFLLNSSISWSGEKSDAEVEQMFITQKISQKEETLNLIIEYFDNWKALKLYTDDLTEEQNKNWSSYTEDKRREILKIVRTKKLNLVLNELNSKEINDLCNESEGCENRKKVIIEIITGLLGKI